MKNMPLSTLPSSLLLIILLHTSFRTGNYSDDDDVSVEDDDGQADGRISALASRTNHLIDSYRDFIAEMSHDPIVGGDADAAAADIVAVMESGGKKTTSTEEEDIPPPSPPEAKKGLIDHFQDVRKGATLYNDYSFKDDDPTPHQSSNVNLHSLRLVDDDHSFSTYDGDFEQNGTSKSGDIIIPCSDLQPFVAVPLYW